jgi:hypothetical protein
MYHDQAPQDATFPYIVFFEVSETPDFTFSTEFEEYRIQFSIFSTSQSAIEVEDVYTKLKSLFDKCALTVTGYTHISMLRENSIGLQRDEDNVWMRHVDYKILLEKSA